MLIPFLSDRAKRCYLGEQVNFIGNRWVKKLARRSSRCANNTVSQLLNSQCNLGDLNSQCSSGSGSQTARASSTWLDNYQCSSSTGQESSMCIGPELETSECSSIELESSQVNSHRLENSLNTSGLQASQTISVGNSSQNSSSSEGREWDENPSTE